MLSGATVLPLGSPVLTPTYVEVTNGGKVYE